MYIQTNNGEDKNFWTYYFWNGFEGHGLDSAGIEEPIYR